MGSEIHCGLLHADALVAVAYVYFSRIRYGSGMFRSAGVILFIKRFKQRRLYMNARNIITFNVTGRLGNRENN